MAYQKLQPTQAVAVSLSDTINVISPSQPAIASGVSDKTITNNARDLSVATLSFTGNPTTITASKLTDDTADFSSVVVGNTVINQSGDTTHVTAVDSSTTLSLADNIFSDVADVYEIYTGGFLGVVSVDDVVWNYTDNTFTAVAAVYSAELELDSNIVAVGEDFRIYGTVGQANSNTEPFVLYVGDGAAAANNVKVLTAAGNEVVFKNVPKGDYIPVQCLRVFATGTNATDLVALW
jgi:hypothetical protein